MHKALASLKRFQSFVAFASRGSMNHAAGAGGGWHPTATTLGWGGEQD
ncbi:hypothetical protein [Pseudomonas donghuensis]